MLVVDISVNRRRHVSIMKIVRGEQHKKLRKAFYYHYQVEVDGNLHIGTVVHSYDNGAIALVQKVSKAVVAQQKLAKASK